MRHLHPDARGLGPVIPGLDLVGQRCAISIHETDICTVGFDLFKIEVGCAERDQDREVGQVLGAVGVVEGDLLAVQPVGVPPALEVGQCIARRIGHIRIRRIIRRVAYTRCGCAVEHAVGEGDVDVRVVGRVAVGGGAKGLAGHTGHVPVVGNNRGIEDGLGECHMDRIDEAVTVQVSSFQRADSRFSGVDCVVARACACHWGIPDQIRQRRSDANDIAGIFNIISRRKGACPGHAAVCTADCTERAIGQRDICIGKGCDRFREGSGQGRGLPDLQGTVGHGHTGDHRRGQVRGQHFRRTKRVEGSVLGFVLGFDPLSGTRGRAAGTG